MASFCDAANLPRETVLPLAPTASTNESMSHEAALLVDSLNRQRPLYRDGKLSPERLWFGIDAMMTVPGNKFSLSPEQEAQARINSRADLRWLNSKFGTDLYPDVFEDALLEEDVRPGTMPQATIDALAISLSNLGNQIQNNKLQVENLQHQFRQLEQERQRADEDRRRLVENLKEAREAWQHQREARRLLQKELEHLRRPWWKKLARIR